MIILTEIQEIQRLWKIQKASSFRTVNIISVMKWGNEQTDRQKMNMKLFEVLYENPRNISRKFEKNNSSRSRYNNCSKEVRQ